MANSSKLRRSCKGVLSGFIAIEVPSTMYNPEGDYSFKFDISDKKDGKNFTAHLDSLLQESNEMGRARNFTNCTGISYPYTVSDEKVQVKFKRSATSPLTNKEVKIKLYDSNNYIIDTHSLNSDTLKIGKGTICEILYTSYKWQTPSTYGVRLEPIAIRILELHTYDSLLEQHADATIEHLFEGSENKGSFVSTNLSPTTEKDEGEGGATDALDWDFGKKPLSRHHRHDDDDDNNASREIARHKKSLGLNEEENNN